MDLRDEGVVDEHHPAARRPSDGHLVVEGEHRALVRTRPDDAQRHRAAASGSPDRRGWRPGGGDGGGRRCAGRRGEPLRLELEHDDPYDARQEQVQERQEAELEDGQEALGHGALYDASNRMVAGPTRISSPSTRTCSPTGAPLTRVPFSDPRSAST